jgi:hypothetical protein
LWACSRESFPHPVAGYAIVWSYASAARSSRGDRTLNPPDANPKRPSRFWSRSKRR